MIKRIKILAALLLMQSAVGVAIATEIGELEDQDVAIERVISAGGSISEWVVAVGAEEQLVGALSETKVDVNVTFPEQYVKELAGKKAKFACKIHEVKTKKYPEINDEFAKGLKIDTVTDVKTLEAYEKGQVANRKISQAKDKQFNEILSKITANAKVVVAPQVIASEAESVKKDMINQINQNGLSIEQYKEITGLTDEKLEEELKRLNEIIEDRKKEVEEIYKQFFSDDGAKPQLMCYLSVT